MTSRRTFIRNLLAFATIPVVEPLFDSADVPRIEMPPPPTNGDLWLYKKHPVSLPASSTFQLQLRFGEQTTWSTMRVAQGTRIHASMRLFTNASSVVLAESNGRW